MVLQNDGHALPMFAFARLLPFTRRRAIAIATALEDAMGAADAVRAVRQQIPLADRRARRRLYALHDEIMRRHGWRPAGLGMRP